jgi:hypothetical protein
MTIRLREVRAWIDLLAIDGAPALTYLNEGHASRQDFDGTNSSQRADISGQIRVALDLRRKN